jgi:NADH:ubiquinone oxidoreductase subunit 3 (subunit A)
MRYGFVALLFFNFTMKIFMDFPATLNAASTWCSGYGFAAVAIFAAIVLFAFYSSLGGQPLFGRVSIED